MLKFIFSLFIYDRILLQYCNREQQYLISYELYFILNHTNITLFLRPYQVILVLLCKQVSQAISYKLRHQTSILQQKDLVHLFKIIIQILNILQQNKYNLIKSIQSNKINIIQQNKYNLVEQTIYHIKNKIQIKNQYLSTTQLSYKHQKTLLNYPSPPYQNTKSILQNTTKVIQLKVLFSTTYKLLKSNLINHHHLTSFTLTHKIKTSELSILLQINQKQNLPFLQIQYSFSLINYLTQFQMLKIFAVCLLLLTTQGCFILGCLPQKPQGCQPPKPNPPKPCGPTWIPTPNIPKVPTPVCVKEPKYPVPCIPTPTPGCIPTPTTPWIKNPCGPEVPKICVPQISPVPCIPSLPDCECGNSKGCKYDKW